MGTTARLGLPFPENADDPTGDLQIEALAEAIDDAILITSGTLAARPAADAVGQYTAYYATDAAQLFLSNGTAWLEVGASAGLPPIGGMLDWGKATVPSDARFALCNGQAVSRATYSALFTLIGTTYGAGDGSTTFNLPDCRGRTTVAPDAGAGRLTGSNTLGASGGTEGHVLTTAQIASHTHGDTLATSSNGDHVHTVGSVGNHTHLVGFAYNTVNLSGPTVGNTHYSNYFGSLTTRFTTNSVGNHDHGVTADGAHVHTLNGAISNAGSGAAHTNLQPYLCVQKIMRIA